VRAAPAQDDDPPQLRNIERVERVRHDVAPGEFVARLGQDACHVERHVAHPDHHGGLARKIGRERGEFGVAVIPPDESRAAEDIAQPIAGQVERPVTRSAGGEDHRVVEAAQLLDAHVLADGDVPHEAHVVRQRGLFIAARDALDRLVIGRNAGADQAERNGQAVEYVDLYIFAPLLERGFGGVVSGGTGTDNGDVPHSFSRACPARFAGC
jgi:hypothetical protein